MPKVSVVMAVHNGELYLSEALDSIFQQSLRDFEFLVIDDASTDGTAEILAACTDPRLHIHTNKSQLGLAASLNLGLEQARGEYIARMDHDDISLPRRLEMQASYLDEHPDVDVLGAWVRTLGQPPEQTWRYPTEDDAIRSELLFNPVLVHSSVMLRRSSLGKHKLRYDPKLPRAQDYDLWTRVAGRLRFANLNKVLLCYRVHSSQVGQRFGEEQQQIANRIRLDHLHRLGIKPNAEQAKLHHAISRWEFPTGEDGLQTLQRWFAALRAANQASAVFPATAFGAALERRWWAACRANLTLGLRAWRIYTGFARELAAERPLADKVVFKTKAALRQVGWRLL
ncbi:MAG: glycosyltransferase [Anaerolineales bacterium]|nr:glycosyltransferase [Anaerolineales bacterium]